MVSPSRRAGRPARKAAPAKSSLDRAPDVVRAAAHLFYERGYDGTSVADVADATGMLKGSLYYYIRTKEDLLYAVVEQAHGQMMALVEEVGQASGQPVLQRLEHFLRRHMEVLIRDREMYGVVLQDYSALSGQRRKQATATRNEYAQTLQSLIEEAQQGGVIPAELNPRLTCLGVLGMMNWTYKWYRPSEPLSKAKVIDGMVDLALRTLGVGPAQPLPAP
jgi:AcrR family transcriptional regulator